MFRLLGDLCFMSGYFRNSFIGHYDYILGQVGSY
jgi:hypothetical protein